MGAAYSSLGRTKVLYATFFVLLGTLISLGCYDTGVKQIYCAYIY